MNSTAKKVSLFGLLTALALVLGLLDRALPLSSLLGGGVPGIKLGLANTVPLYAVYLMNWQSALLLMLVKVILSGFLFGSLSAILYSLSGGVLSLAVMLLLRPRPKAGALFAALLALFSDVYLLIRNSAPRGQLLWTMLLILLAALAGAAVFLLLRAGRIRGITAVSMAGAVAHNLGQILAASLLLNSPLLLITYLPVLAGVGAAVGCLTGIVGDRVLSALGHRELL